MTLLTSLATLYALITSSGSNMEVKVPSVLVSTVYSAVTIGEACVGVQYRC